MLQELAEEYRFQILAMEVMLDRIHLLVDCRKQKQQKTEIQKRSFSSIDDCVNTHFCNIVSNNLQWHEAYLPYIPEPDN